MSNFEEVTITENKNGKSVKTAKSKKKKIDLEVNFEVEQFEFFNEHYYKAKINNEIIYLPSVTTILNASPKPFLSKWRGDLGNLAADKYMKDAAESGSTIHAACEALVNGKKIIYHKPNSKNFSLIISDDSFILYDQFQFLQVYRFQKLLEALKPASSSSEQTIYSLKDEYAGTLDLVIDLWNEDKKASFDINGSKPLELENGVYIGDLKTGNNIYSENYMQVSAYIKAYQKLNPDQNVKGGLIIHTNSSTKKGIEGLSVKLITLDEAEIYYQQFLKIYEVWKINPSPGKPTFFELPTELTYSITN